MAWKDQLDSSWDRALEDYEKETGSSYKELARPKDVQDLLYTVDSRIKSFDEWRHKSTTFHKVLRGLGQPIMLVSNFASGPVGTVFPGASVCFGAITSLVSATQKTSAALDNLSALLEQLQDFLVRLKVYNQVELPQDMREKCAQVLATVLTVIGRATKVTKSKKFWTRAKTTGKILLTGKDDFSPLFDTLQKLVDSEVNLIGAETFSTSQKQLVKLGDISTQLDQQSAKLDEQSAIIQESYAITAAVGDRTARMETKLDAQAMQKDFEHIVKVLGPTCSPRERYMEIDRKRVRGTCEWIFENPSFNSWLHGKDPILYVSGIPGSGESGTSLP